MSKRPWMPLYVGDYLADTVDLRPEEHGCYVALLMLAWRRPDGALPDDMNWLRRALNSCMVGMHGNRFNNIVPTLLSRFFVRGKDGKLRNKRLTKERKKARTLSGKQRDKAKKRWAEQSKNKELRNAVADATANASADANAMPLHSHSHSQSKKEGGFDQFWSSYPHKIGKADARSAFERAIKKPGVTLAVILDGIRRYVAAKPPDRAWCNPSTFLNQERWADQPAELGVKNGNGAHEPEPSQEALERMWRRQLDTWRETDHWPFQSPQPGRAGCKIPDDFIERWRREAEGKAA